MITCSLCDCEFNETLKNIDFNEADFLENAIDEFEDFSAAAKKL